MDEVLPYFTPIFNSFPSIPNHSKYRLESILHPHLAILNSVSHFEDFCVLLKQCASALKVKTVALDVRLLIHYPQKPKGVSSIQEYEENLSENSHDFDDICDPYIDVMYEITVDKILQQAPCILYIQNIDYLFEEDRQQLQQFEGIKSLEMIAIKAVESLLHNLFNEIRKRFTIDSEHMDPLSVAIVTAASSYQLISNDLLWLFPIQINLSTHLTLQKDDVIMIYDRKIKNLNIPTSQPLLEEVLKLVEDNGIGKSRLIALLNQILYSAKVRILRINWLSEINQSTNSDITTMQTNEILIEDLKKSIQQCPFLYSKQKNKMSVSNTKILPVHWDDIGGLERVRKEILEVIEWPMKFPHLFPPGCPRRQGILLYGPPGTGKTLVAKAVATECNMSFLSVKGPELLDSYVGESERNIRNLFSNARSMAPCVLFFDEIDSLAPARARGNDSGGGVMDRIVSQLLTEMDQLSSTSLNQNIQTTPDKKELEEVPIAVHPSKLQRVNSEFLLNDIYQSEDNISVEHDVDINQSTVNPAPITQTKWIFVIAATNRPDLLDQALMRPGRFDRKIYLGVCKDAGSRYQILLAQTRKFELEEKLNLNEIAQNLPANVTGADIGFVTSMAYQIAMNRKLLELKRKALMLMDSNVNDEDETDFVSITEDTLMNMDTNLESFLQHQVNNVWDDKELKIVVQQGDFLEAMQRLVATNIDLQHFEQLEKKYNDSNQTLIK